MNIFLFLEKLQENTVYIQAAFLLIVLMFYTRKIKTFLQAISVWFIAVLFSSLTVPAIVELYLPDQKNNVELISLIVVLFDVIIVPVIIRVFAKELFTEMLENKIIKKLRSKKENDNE
jgi:predicted Na+-dependent transporter